MLKRKSLELLAELYDRPMRYSELKKSTGWSDSSLCRRLDELEELGLVKLTAKRSRSGRNFIEYELTFQGLCQAVTYMMALEVDKAFEYYMNYLKPYLDEVPPERRAIAEEEAVERFEKAIKSLLKKTCEDVVRDVTRSK